ncbi:hypothetical protein ACFXK0_01995 [Nocardia sp. NPDC059177]|uniref:hypothetical protein n=1 Tax=Nocardia sp. NPDC059177 TaxID=3346759 RepID=UPI0036C80B19
MTQPDPHLWDAPSHYPAPVQAADDPFLCPAPALPLPPRPDAVFTASPGTAARLAHRGALRVVLRPASVITSAAALLLMLPLTALLGLWLPAVVLLVVGIGGPVSSYLATRRRLRRTFDLICAPGAAMAVQLGPDALDIADTHSYVRIAYERITAIRTSGAMVVLHVDGLRLNFPRELFPAPMAEHLRHLIWNRAQPLPGSPAPLPALPTLLQPQATLVADDATAPALYAAEIREPLLRRSVQIRFVVTAVVATGLLGWLLGPGWMLLPILMCAIMTYATVRAVRKPGPDAVRRVRHAVPGAVLATQFGSDAVVYQTVVHLLRTPYSDITKIVLRPDVAVVHGGYGLTVIPRALFPEQVVSELRRRGVTISTG